MSHAQLQARVERQEVAAGRRSAPEARPNAGAEERHVQRPRYHAVRRASDAQAAELFLNSPGGNTFSGIPFFFEIEIFFEIERFENCFEDNL